MRSPTFIHRSYAVLASLSTSYPPLQGTFRYITHPFATRRQGCPRAAVRLACVRHAASVQSEPGSNSSVQSLLWHCCQVPQNRRPLKILTGNLLRSYLYFLRALDALSSTAISIAAALPPSAHTYRLLLVKEPFLPAPSLWRCAANRFVRQQQRNEIMK